VSHQPGYSQSLHANGSVGTRALGTSSIFATTMGALFMTFVHNWPTFEFFRSINLSVKIIDQHENIRTH
jgi:hypothetical protein